MPQPLLTAAVIVALAGSLIACQPEQEQPADKIQGPSRKAALQVSPEPPKPPLFEDFEGEPKLSLFPRIGDYRPEKGDQAVLPFYNSYLDHLIHTAGVVKTSQDGHAFLIRSVAQLESVGFFSPVAVEPNRRYHIDARIQTDLPENARIGIGILEFDRFLWVPEQYSRSLAKQHQVGMQEGLQLTGSRNWHPQSFEIVTGPDTHMIHLVFYLEGTNQHASVLFDDVEVAPVR